VTYVTSDTFPSYDIKPMCKCENFVCFVKKINPKEER
jgi:hypothetical protein